MNNYNRVQLKQDAKRSIKENVINLLLGSLLAMVLMGPVNFMPFLGQIISIALIVIVIGLNKFYLDFVDNKNIDYTNIFYSFKVKDANTYFIHLGTIIAKYIFVFLWSLLLVIPGIIKNLAYSQVEYIRAENTDQDIMSCLKESEELMRGHKAEYFVLQLSFIGWFILTPFTLGLLLIYVLPYYQTTMALYYRNLRPLVENNEQPKDKYEYKTPIIS